MAKRWQDQGYSAYKLALGYGVDIDTETVAAVREAVGDRDKIMVDAHWRYTVPEAIALGHELEKLGLFFLEAPTAPEDTLGQAEIARALTVPVAVGEELSSTLQVMLHSKASLPSGRVKAREFLYPHGL